MILVCVMLFLEIQRWLPGSWSYFLNFQDFVYFLISLLFDCDQNVAADHRIINIIQERRHERKWTVQLLAMILQLVVCFALDVQHGQGKRSRKRIFPLSQMKINLDEFKSLLACH